MHGKEGAQAERVHAAKDIPEHEPVRATRSGKGEFLKE